MKAVIEQIEQKYGAYILSHTKYAGEDTFLILSKDLLFFMQVLKEEFHFEGLIDITATDRLTEEERFELAYNLVSYSQNIRIRVKTRVEEDNPHVPSLVDIWKSANWYEREAYDMMGIIFDNHPDLRRMFLPEDFIYFPLRKEFPLIGVQGSIPLPEKDPPKEYK
ncbi:MAG: NADH-quinone oxidoreductase subunit C [Bacteroidia bacterium]|nr:NADH-quinone oxidoreductase subunit C [Bacteroidia bacterium]MDW8345376.1 NADH-quinone oxidoreductase subunit C [Bacteroidia bacterium]